jgi:SAM-dependent methyltransferase
MSLANDYRRQRAWRDWPTIFDALPLRAGELVLDLGCAVGDQAIELVARGASVIGIDVNDDLVAEARARAIAGADFRVHDLRALPDLGVAADGIWSSFTAAYFPSFAPTLTSWSSALRPGGWIALTEIDDLFGHEPVAPTTRSLLDAYVRDARDAGRYDFQMGRRLPGYVEQCGFTISRTFTVEDQELSFTGPARPEIIDAWRARFDRMTLLHGFCGTDYDDVRDDFLACLASAAHRSIARVVCCIAVRR